ncbi:diguanylate cyclase domain-containing protein [Bremerella sp.]|uniref:diguanylate cyclase domain-containing protein n=1 Tax=Bremerella sp. TaxID=2795602 RepID=UPI003918E6D8
MHNRLLVIESTEVLRSKLRDALSEHHEVYILESVDGIREKIEEIQPALILLDFHLRDDSALEVCRAIRREFADRQIQLLVMGHELNESQRLEMFAAGADNVIDKSIGRLELIAKIDVLMRLHSALMRATTAERKLEGYSRELERIVENRSMAIQSTQDIAVFALAKLADSRDTETGEHLVRMRAYSQMIAEQLRISGPYQDSIDDVFLQDLFRSSPLHDIGKVGISDAILLKPGKLTAEEFNAMKQHVRIGAETLQEAARSSPSGSFFHMAAEIARYHHERWDGCGYLEGLKGAEIPLAARIVSVADVFDALSSKRVYKDAMSTDEARALIREGSGNHFDPAIVSAFDETFDKIEAFSAEQHSVVRFLDANSGLTANYHWGKHLIAPELGGENAVVINDGSPSIGLIIKWLESVGMHVRTCGEYEAAKQLLREECPMVVISDWGQSQAAEMFCRWIREERLPRYVYTMVLADRGTLADPTLAYRLGIDDVISHTISREELLSRINSASRVIELENHLRTVERNDPLTGLATLRYLNDQLKREWVRARNYHLPISCIVIDIDDFSEINQDYGVEAGDLVLQQLAKTITEQSRQIDYLCRLDSDRLLLVLPECAEVNAYRVAMRIEMLVDKMVVEVHGHQINCSVSMGVAQRNNDVPNLEALIDNAEIALKAAKSSGKRHVVCLGSFQQSFGVIDTDDQVRDRLEHLAASEIMTSPILAIEQSDTIATATQFLVKEGLNSAPVVDQQGVLVGIISEKDIMQAFRRPEGRSTLVSAVMRSEVVRFDESAPAIHVYEYLSQAAIRRVVVVKDDRPVGVISRGNCLRWVHQLDVEVGLGDPSKLADVLDSGIMESATLSQIREMIKGMEHGPATSSVDRFSF